MQQETTDWSHLKKDVTKAIAVAQNWSTELDSMRETNVFLQLEVDLYKNRCSELEHGNQQLHNLLASSRKENEILRAQVAYWQNAAKPKPS